MNKIFIGMLLIFLGFDINIGNSTIGVIPTFIGYIFMLKGVVEISELSDKFSKIIPCVKIMISLSIITYILDLLGLNYQIQLPVELHLLGIALLLIGLFLAATVFTLYISYNIIMGIKDIEEARGKNLYSSRLYSIWKIRIILLLWSFGMVLASFISPLTIVFGGMFAVAIFFLEIYNLYVFNKSRLAFYTEN